MNRVSLYLISLSLLVVAGLMGSFLAWTELPGHWRLLATNELYRDAVALEEIFPDLDVQGVGELKSDFGYLYGVIFIRSLRAEPWDEDVLEDFYLTTISMMAENFPLAKFWVFVFVGPNGLLQIEIDCPNGSYVVMEDLYKGCDIFPFYLPKRARPEHVPWIGRYPFAP